MSPANPPSHGFSADVRMELHVNGHVFSIGQLGPDFIILDDPVDHPPADAEIAMSIDGRARRWAVRLPEGVSVSQRRTPTVRGSQVNGSTVR